MKRSALRRVKSAHLKNQADALEVFDRHEILTDKVTASDASESPRMGPPLPTLGQWRKGAEGDGANRMRWLNALA